MNFIYFLNRLKQTISFKLIAISGYLLIAFELYSFYVWVPIEIKNSIDPEFGGLGAIIIVIFATFGYYIAVLILAIMGIIEYILKIRKNKFNENKNTFFSILSLILFIIGLILPVIYLFLFLNNYLL